MKLLLWDTLSNTKKNFSPLQKKEIKVYVCGITPYSFSHIGHGRSFVNFDVLIRTLLFLGFEVTYVRNYTDIDDKILARAQEEIGNRLRYSEISEKYIKDFQLQMKALNCLPPSFEPRATKSIPSIIKIIKKLIEKGFAYKAENDVFFDVSKFKNYGNLSKKKVSDLIPGARVNVNEKKNNPLDFVLWKSDQPGQFWETEIGSGRPGWHIECSAMIAEYCGEQVDIHGGGIDLIFPHHENEIAQSEACFDKKLANTWMHNNFINIKKEKMSKSLNNSISMNDYFKIYSADAFRFYILQHHYRSQIDFSDEKLISATKAKNNLNTAFFESKCKIIPNPDLLSKIIILEDGEKKLFNEIIESLLDDLNTANSIGLIFKNLEEIKKNENLATIIFSFLSNVLGLNFQEKTQQKNEVPQKILILIEERKKARESKNWALADSIREEIIKQGFNVIDEAAKK